MHELEAIRLTIQTVGAENLVVDDLTEGDLPLIAWAGDQLHLQAVTQAVALVASGKVDYLAVRAPDRQPIAIGGITYTEAPGVGVIWQLSTRVQGMGLGSALIAAAESRIRHRGLKTARLEVEDDNPRARVLYERLGYREVSRHPASWQQQREDGTAYLYKTMITALDKGLSNWTGRSRQAGRVRPHGLGSDLRARVGKLVFQVVASWWVCRPGEHTSQG